MGTTDDRLDGFITEQVARYLRSVEENERLNLSAFLDMCESPIERYMGAALAYMEAESFGVRPIACWLNTKIYGRQFDSKDLEHGNCFIWVSPQHPIEVGGSAYRVDFLIAAKPYHTDEVFYVVVECDGHAFHERTKDQAQRDKARDRAMTAEGLMVFRFTGAEIYADANKCASEIAAFLNELASRSWERSELCKDFDRWLEEQYSAADRQGGER